MERLADFYLDLAGEMFPVVEVDAGRPVELVLSRGAGESSRPRGRVDDRPQHRELR
jgi:conjugal transfer pilus assembly protein TraB